MINWIVKNWWRNKGKFLLLLIGALLISSGLSFLIGLSETNKGTIINSLEKKWRASYDIVVRPKGSESITEENNLLDPNYLSGLSGGISSEDLKTIKEIEDVSIAAPISILGYTSISPNMGEMKFEEKGIYRKNFKYVENDGIRNYTTNFNSYFGIGLSINANSFESVNRYGLFVENQEKTELNGTFTMLLAAIDPKAEAELVGLEDAVIKSEKSRFFQEKDKVITNTHEGLGAQVTQLPVILSNMTTINYSLSYTLEKLNLSTNSQADLNSLLKKIEENGKDIFLDTLPSTHVESVSFTSDEAHRILINQLMKEGYDQYLLLKEKPSSLNYQSIATPFPERWENAYEIDSPDQSEYQYPLYREKQQYNEEIAKLPRLDINIIGLYDPKKLNISSDPETELPMETYRAPTATYVLDSKGSPVNPPTTVTATSNPFGYLMQSPTMLTTMEAAQDILGDKPISAIRIKVEGVSTLNNSSQAKLEKIATEIEHKTGLRADITLGSSPRPVLIHIPDVGEIPELGWVEQPWIKMGASINILRESTLGYTWIIGCLVIVSIIYVFATNLIAYLSRRQEFAILKSIGWKNNKLRNVLMIESILIGGLVSFITLIVLFFLKFENPDSLSYLKIATIVCLIFLIYILGALYPSYMVNKINPMQVIKQGEISLKGARIGRTKGITGVVRNNLLGRWVRNLVSLFAISLPCALLILFVFVSLRLDGVLYTTWLGEYVSMEVGTSHYLSIALSLTIAILTTSEIIWQNVLERQKEIALFKALGWKNRRIRVMVLLEGASVGFVSGILGNLFSIMFLYFMYGSLPTGQWWLFSISVVIPVIVGVISAVIPSVKAIRIEPYKGLKH